MRGGHPVNETVTVYCKDYHMTALQYFVTWLCFRRITDRRVKETRGIEQEKKVSMKND